MIPLISPVNHLWEAKFREPDMVFLLTANSVRLKIKTAQDQLKIKTVYLLGLLSQHSRRPYRRCCCNRPS